MLLRRFVYVQVHRGYFIARVVGGTAQVSHECAELNHPRSLFNKFEPIRAAFASTFRELGAFRFGCIRPAGLVHLIEEMEGGYTQAELRAFREAAEAAGMRNVLMLDDKHGPVTDDQLAEEILPVLPSL